MDGSRTCRCLARIVPDGRDGKIVFDIAFFSRKYLAQYLLELSPRGLAQFEEVICSYVDFRLPRREWRQVDGVDVAVSREHKLQLEPLDFLHPKLGEARRCEGFADIRTPTDDFLILIVVQDSGDLAIKDVVRPGKSIMSDKISPIGGKCLLRTFCLV